MAVSNEKIIDFNIVKKGFKSDTYTKFINKLASKDKENTFSYFMDNAKIHTSKKAMKCYKQNQTHIIFNAPYHSEFILVLHIFWKVQKMM